MSNCSSPVCPVDSAPDDGADIAELAAVWAVLNVVEAGTAESDREIAEIRRGFNQILAEHSLAPADVFDYIAEHADQCNWRALGLSGVEPEVENALMSRTNDRHRQRASAHTDTKAETVSGASETMRNQVGGEIRIANQQGRFIDSSVVSDPRHRKSSARDPK